MGTRFCATVEAPIHQREKQMMVDDDERSTNLIFRSLRNTGRVGKNSVSDKVVEILKQPGAKFEDVSQLVRGANGRALLETGDLDAGLVWAGQVQGLIHDIPTAAELISGVTVVAAPVWRTRAKLSHALVAIGIGSALKRAGLPALQDALRFAAQTLSNQLSGEISPEWNLRTAEPARDLPRHPERN